MKKKILSIFLITFLLLVSSASPITTYNCNGLTGGTQRDLDYLSVDDLNNGDRALVLTGTLKYHFKYDSTATDAENTTTHPFKVRPDDYATAGVWIEQELATGSVDAGILAADSVGTSEIATDAVGSAEIAANAVGEPEIGTNAVGPEELVSDLEIKAWVQFNGTTGSIAINDSYNVDSVTWVSAGKYTISWATDFANSNYAMCVMSAQEQNNIIVFSAATAQIQLKTSAGVAADAGTVCIIAIGDQ